MSLRAVVFDLDGVLCSSIGYHYRAWKKTLQRYDIPFTRADNERLRGLTRRKSLERILNGARLPEARMQAILEEKNRHYLEYLKEMSPADLAPGAGPLLQELHAAGLKLAVASSSRNARPALQRLGIEAYFTAVVDGNQVQRSKPDPAAFLQAAASLAVLPSACIAVEDSPDGIQAALSAGMFVVGLGDSARDGGACAHFPSLESVRLADLLAVYSPRGSERAAASGRQA